MSFSLVKLQDTNKEQFLDMMKEWDFLEKNIKPYRIVRHDYKDYENYVKNLEVPFSYTKDDTDSTVENSVYFLWDNDRNKMLGGVDIRHSLNKYLENFGGHIGYGIRPLERNKGYATELLRLSLLELKKLKVYKVLLVCEYYNISSAKVIERNGGVLDNVVTDGKSVLKRYWIYNKPGD